MLKLLKNVGVTAGFTVVATMATAAVVSVFALLTTWDQMDQASDPGILSAGVSAALMAGGLGGALFSVFTLGVAALTLPPTIGVAHALKLPRPLVDCIGGGVAGLICSAAAIGAFESLARSKGGGAPGADMKLIFDIYAMVGGGVLGYLRHRVLAKPSAPAVQALVPA